MLSSAVLERGAGSLAPVVTLTLALSICACGTPSPRDYDSRIERASRGLEADAYLQARRAEVEAAIARESSETPIDEVELRIEDVFNTENSDTRDNRLRLTTRVPLPDPAELRAIRSARRAETEAAVSRLEETALEVGAERCLRGVAARAHRLRSEIYAVYSDTYARLIRWNQESMRAGRISEPAAMRFELESRIDLVRSMPDPAPPGEALAGELPAIVRPSRALVTTPELLHQTVRLRSPTVRVHEAIADRYRALSARAAARGRPWPAFFDLMYEASADGDRREAGAQVAFRIPVGPAAREMQARYDALGRSERRLGSGEVDEKVRLGLIALREIDAFEQNSQRWLELLDLAGRAESAANLWWERRLASPSQVGALLDRAHAARSSVIDAREEAGKARCVLLAATGVALEAWPRE